MQYVKPMPFSEAVQKLGDQSVIGSKLNSEQWTRVPGALRDNAFFSATIESARFLQAGKDFLGDFLNGARDESGALAASGRAQFVKEMSAFAVEQGMGPLEPEDAGGLKDITSQARLSLIYNTKVQQAQDFGYWQQGQDPDVLDAFPAQRFIREAEVATPRPIHQQNEGVVRLKSDLDFWLGLNSPEIGGFGVPWGPWGFNSGMGVEDVERGEAEQLGLISASEKAVPVEKEFNDRLQASARGLDPELREQLKAQFGDQIDIEGDAVKWRGTKSEVGGQKTEVAAVPPTPEEEPVRSAPVSAAIDNRIKNSMTRAAVNNALDLIDSVHSDGVLPPLKIDATVKAKRIGEYSSVNTRIGIKPSGPHPELTTLHEVGHFLDHHGIGSPAGFASFMNDPLLAEWRTAVGGSAAFGQWQTALAAMPDSEAYTYLLKPQELFARSYAQYVAETSNDPKLLEQLGLLKATRQWTAADFAPIRAALDKLFTQLGWL